MTTQQEHCLKILNAWQKPLGGHHYMIDINGRPYWLVENLDELVREYEKEFDIRIDRDILNKLLLLT